MRSMVVLLSIGLCSGYVKYAQLFGDAQFIWTRNLLLDNLVLSRYVAKAPAQ